MRLGPFFKRKEVWMPTWRSWTLAFLLGAGLLVGFVKLIPPFLAPNRPLNAPVLVVEGWMSEQGLLKAIELSKLNQYKLVIVTGEPIEKGMTISSYESYGNLGVSRLRELGFTGTNLVSVPGPKVRKDRTYHSALATCSYIRTNTNFREADLLGSGTHGRRSWLLFKIAGRPDIKFGVIRQVDLEIDLDRWWRGSYGVRAVIDELAGYIYAKIAFTPD